MFKRVFGFLVLIQVFAPNHVEAGVNCSGAQASALLAAMEQAPGAKDSPFDATFLGTYCEPRRTRWYCSTSTAGHPSELGALGSWAENFNRLVASCTGQSDASSGISVSRIDCTRYSGSVYCSVGGADFGIRVTPPPARSPQQPTRPPYRPEPSQPQQPTRPPYRPEYPDRRSESGSSRGSVDVALSQQVQAIMTKKNTPMGMQSVGCESNGRCKFTRADGCEPTRDYAVTGVDAQTLVRALSAAGVRPASNGYYYSAFSCDGRGACTVVPAVVSRNTCPRGN